MYNFDLSSVVITGASRGIGEAAARAFAKAGASVTLGARSEEEIAKIADDIGPKAQAIPCDVSRFESVANLIAKAKERFGSVDVLINNAAVIDPIAPLESTPISEWDRLIDINVKGVFYGIRSALPIMKAQGGGTIITIGSGAATHALEGWSGYCTSKAAIHHLHKVLHHEESQNGIRSLVNSPGTVATNMQRQIKASRINPVSALPWEKHIPSEWVAKTLVWMCTKEADAHLGDIVALRGEALEALIARA